MDFRNWKLIAASLIVFIGLSVNPARAQFTAMDDNYDPDRVVDFGETDIVGTFEIGGVKIKGAKFADTATLLVVSGLDKGAFVKLPYDERISRAMTVLWNQGMFSDIAILIDRVEDTKIYLTIEVEERPRLTTVAFTGVNKTQETEIKTKAALVSNKMITESLKQDVIARTKTYFAEKGYNNASVTVTEKLDPKVINGASLLVQVDKGDKVKINLVNFEGNDNFTQARLKRAMKGTKEMARISLYPADRYTAYTKPDRSLNSYLREGGMLSLSKTLDHLNPYFRYNVLSASKFDTKKFQEDKSGLIELYNSAGYRDARVVDDTVYTIETGHLNVEVKVEEGKKYYFGNISWKGNTKHSDSLLTELLGIKKGDVYNKDLINAKIAGRATMEGGIDVGSVYLNDGYLGYRGEAIEKEIRNDTIDFDIVITEGPQFRVRNVNIVGNQRTNDYVFRREMFLFPGEIYNHSQMIRSVRQVSQMGFIDPQKVTFDPKPNMQDKTVDIDFKVAEKSSDQLELSAGYGGFIGFTGTVGLTFNNFSLKNLMRPKTWDPLPMGDGQRLQLRYQSSGLWFNSLTFAFTEPWLGGKKPIALNVALNYGRFAQNSGMSFTDNTLTGSPHDSYIRNLGGNVSLSRRLRWPDNNFIFSLGVDYMNFKMKDYPLLAVEVPEYRNGFSNNLALKITVARNTLDQVLFPRSGSSINLTMAFTPPVSLLSDNDYSTMTARERYSWVEYHKYKFTTDWYQRLVGNFVLRLSAKMGFMGFYNRELGFSPFERFQVGGDGLSGFNFFVGRDIIAHRGYDVYTTNGQPNSYTIFNKYTAEVRYPFTLDPSATIYGLVFFEAANGYNNMKEYNPLNVYRSTGVGLRVFLPMFGLLGLDYGLGLDNLYDVNGNRNPFNVAAKFTFMLGQEPQ